MNLMIEINVVNKTKWVLVVKLGIIVTLNSFENDAVNYSS